MKKKKHIAVLGSTGSIGTQALEVIKAHPENFCVEVLTANDNADSLIQQAIEFKPNCVVIADATATGGQPKGESKYEKVKSALSKYDVKVFAGNKSIEQVVQMDTIDIVLAGIVGYAGLASVISAIKAKKQIALANKETLVVAGELVTALAKENGVNIYPVDSEHSAIFQCMAGEWDNPIEKVYLTASGGPFRGKDSVFLSTVTKAQALKHPNWEMGAKITIDSATLMNKGLEVIEAKWLFHLKPEQIKVIIHPQSIIHSIVQFEDGSMKSQMGLPDMKLPIQYALGFPQRLKSEFPRFDFTGYSSFTFEQPDTKTFRCLPLAYEVMKKGGNAPCVLNAANEVAVQLFLEEKIPFIKIPEVIEKTIEKVSFIAKPTYNDFVTTDAEARLYAKETADILMPITRKDTNYANTDTTPKTRIDMDDISEEKIIYKELSYKITGILFKIHEKLGRFAKEKEYGNLLAEYLTEEGVNFTKEKNHSATTSGVNRPDFTIENKIVIELKAKTFITKDDYYQTLRYLEITNMKLGLIANFRQRYLKPKRIINAKARA